MSSLIKYAESQKTNSNKLVWKSVYIAEGLTKKEDKNKVRHALQKVIFSEVEFNKEVFKDLKKANFFKVNANKIAVIEFLKMNADAIKKIQ